MPITDHRLTPVVSSDEDAWSGMEAIWERVCRRWGMARVGMVVAQAEDEHDPRFSVLEAWGLRGPCFRISSRARGGVAALGWAYDVVVRRELDAAFVVGAEPSTVATLVLERQGDACCELLGVRSLREHHDWLRTLGPPGWVVRSAAESSESRLPRWRGAAPKVWVDGDATGSSALVRMVAGIRETLDGHALPAWAWAAALDADMVWAVDGDTAAPVRVRD